MLLLHKTGPAFDKNSDQPLQHMSKTIAEKISDIAEMMREASDAFFDHEGTAIEEEYPEDRFAYGMNCAQ